MLDSPVVIVVFLIGIVGLLLIDFINYILLPAAMVRTEEEINMLSIKNGLKTLLSIISYFLF